MEGESGVEIMAVGQGVGVGEGEARIAVQNKEVEGMGEGYAAQGEPRQQWEREMELGRTIVILRSRP